jgi:hypothetical protein
VAPDRLVKQRSRRSGSRLLQVRALVYAPPVFSAQTVSEEAARRALLPRLCCPACGGMIVPAIPTPGMPQSGDPPATCLDCDAVYPWVRGILDLTLDSKPPAPRPTAYPFGGGVLDFHGFFLASLKTRAYEDHDLEDELFTLLGWMDLDPGAPVVQLGVGLGEATDILAAACPESPWLGLDDDIVSLRGSRVALTRAGRSNVVLVRCDLDRPPLRAGTFRSVLHLGVLHGLPGSAGHLRRLAAVLPVGGKLAGVTLARSNLPHLAAQQSALGAKAGIRWVAMEHLAKRLMGRGWVSLRHEQPSNWMARFVAVRAPVEP